MVAGGIAAQRSLSEVIFCSDGMANIGVGALDRSRKASAAFYSRIAAAAKSARTTISVVAIEGGDVALDELSTIVNQTGRSKCGGGVPSPARQVAR